ncbi:MAG: hypothetical protein LBP92_09965 [Deltaproteobacteria bacterium]|nr:hypothetical protein [Deltaproteobacteria bacterium]
MEKKPGQDKNRQATLASWFYFDSRRIDAHVKTPLRPENDRPKTYYQGIILAVLCKAGFLHQH